MAGLEGGCAPLSAALSSIQGRGNQVCGGQQRQHRANGGDITSGATCGGWQCRRDSGVMLRGRH